ncbi:MAG TPA: hypothetical protein VEX38_02930 [Fimbriimonadaceae bacterium]|nr:hypothetical protein [Fimbriimonadaceae bacterium]
MSFDSFKEQMEKMLQGIQPRNDAHSKKIEELREQLAADFVEPEAELERLQAEMESSSANFESIHALVRKQKVTRDSAMDHLAVHMKAQAETIRAISGRH